MSDGRLTIDHGEVRLGGTLVPGVFAGMDVADSVRFDEAGLDNISGKKKIPMGWKDSLLTLDLDLLTDDTTCYEKLASLNAIFKGMDNNSNPKVYDIVNAHAAARGVEQVVFETLRSMEGSKDDVIRIMLDFVEHNPPTIPPEFRSSANNSSAPQLDGSGDVAADEAITADKVSPFASGRTDGHQAVTS